jgi:hypothetical protein
MIFWRKSFSNILLARIIPYIDETTEDFDATDQLPIRYSTFSSYSRKDLRVHQAIYQLFTDQENL